MDWQDCNDSKLVKQVSVDKDLVDALLKSSELKLESNNRLELDEVTSSTKIGIVYDSLRELLEAIAIKKGFKIYNHDCFCPFLYEICREKQLSDEFNRFRKVRNQVNYYGKNVPLDEAKILIKGMIALRVKIKKLL